MHDDLAQTKDILLNVESKEIRMATSYFGHLTDLIIERRGTKQITGNIYKGKVTNLLEGIQGAFINIGEGSSGFIHTTELAFSAKKLEEMFDMDSAAEEETSSEEEEVNISEELKEGDERIVQVVKEAMGSKACRLTSNISIPGSLLVLLPTAKQRGVSRKIDDLQSRNRLKKILKAAKLPKDYGFICRTASRSVTDPEAFSREAERLVSIWEEIIAKYDSSKSAPELLYEESDLIKRALMTALDRGFNRIIFDDQKAYKKCQTFYNQLGVDPEKSKLKIELFKPQASSSDRKKTATSLFEYYNLERQIEKAMRNKVWIDDGYLIFDQTEAMITIDVNSGRSSTTGKNLDAAIANFNVKAAEEIARQIRIRNLGGLIICDFIDMQHKSNKRKVLDALKNAMRDDSAKFTILGMSDFGLIEMTRQRSRESLHHTIMRDCHYCNGLGLIKKDESVLIEIERALRKIVQVKDNENIELVTHPSLEMKRGDRLLLDQITKKARINIHHSTSDIIHVNDFHFFSVEQKEMIDV